MSIPRKIISATVAAVFIGAGASAAAAHTGQARPATIRSANSRPPTPRPATPRPPALRAGDFGGPIDNPYLPLTPGARWVYDVTSADGPARIVVEVTAETRQIEGIDAVVVRDTLTKDGQVTEDTIDWYAQDRAGNVWYLGEDTKEYQHGVVSSTAGSWEAGANGARAGIIMKAHPRVGTRYHQEFLAGEAEDEARILSTTASVSVPFGTYTGDVLKTKDFTTLEPGVAEHKFYARGVGVVAEQDVKGGTERVELVEHTTP